MARNWMARGRDAAPAAEGGFALAAMAGALGGAVGGTALGAALASASPIACGTLGTMLGSGCAAGGWCLLVRLWSALFPRGKAANTWDDAARSEPVTRGWQAG